MNTSTLRRLSIPQVYVKRPGEAPRWGYFVFTCRLVMDVASGQAGPVLARPVFTVNFETAHGAALTT